MAKVVIGVDPHKRINAVVVVNTKGVVLAQGEFPNTADGFRELKVFWRQWRPRTWAVEGCNGVGKHLAQRLVFEGERVLDVSTRRAALVRVYAGGNGRKTDDTDAHAIAMAPSTATICLRYAPTSTSTRCGSCRTGETRSLLSGSRRCVGSAVTCWRWSQAAPHDR